MGKDFVSVGALVGIIGAITQDVYGEIVKHLGITDRAFLDFAKVILYYKPQGGTLGFVAGIISHLTFGAILGVLFTYSVRKASNTNPYILGAVLGAAVWFCSLGMGTLYNIPLFKNIPPVPALSIFAGSQVWGFITAFSYRIIAKKSN